MEFKSVEFKDASGVTPSFKLRSGERGVVYSKILIARFDGEYRIGSRGGPDAYFIYAMTQAAVTVWHPDALLLDFSNLDYQWGDEMGMLLALHDRGGLPTAVLGGEKCLPAIATLVFGEKTTQLATERDGIFENLDEALFYLESKLKAKRDELHRKYPPQPPKR
jgi:hypothetical protein